MPPRTRRSVPRGVPAAAGAADRAGAASAGPSGAAAAEAPTPRLEVVLELQSATTASGSAAEAPAAAAAAPAAGARTFTLKPRVVRRADDERKALAEQEEKKFHDKAAEDARRRRASRVRGGRGRGRGDFAGGRDGLVRRIAGAADGPFSQAPLALQRGGRSAGTSGGGDVRAGGLGGWIGGGQGSAAAARAGGAFLSASGGGDEQEARLNTETFNSRIKEEHDYGSGGATAVAGVAGDSGGSGVGSSSSSGLAAVPARTASAASQSDRKPQLLPMGIHREEHREPGVVVATTAELEAAEQEATRAATAVDDPSDDEDTVTESVAPASGAGGRRSTRRASAAVKREPAADSVPADGKGSKQAAKAKPRAKPLPAASKDAEDLAVEQGLQAMLHDLAVDRVDDGVDGEQQLQQQQTAEAPRREGRLFLFQFPPVLPTLQASSPGGGGGGGQGAARSGSGLVKQEPDMLDDVVMLDSVAPVPTASSSGAAGAIDLTNDSAAAGGLPSGIGGGGFLGTLSIRRSGRAELSWGGMTFEMMPGMDVQFVTTAVLLETADEKPRGTAAGAGSGGESAAPAGHAFGMGPVGGKYNLVPVFSEETEWVVDPAELVVEGGDAEAGAGVGA